MGKKSKGKQKENQPLEPVNESEEDGGLGNIGEVYEDDGHAPRADDWGTGAGDNWGAQGGDSGWGTGAGNWGADADVKGDKKSKNKKGNAVTWGDGYDGGAKGGNLGWGDPVTGGGWTGGQNKSQPQTQNIPGWGAVGAGAGGGGWDSIGRDKTDNRWAPDGRHIDSETESEELDIWDRPNPGKTNLTGWRGWHEEAMRSSKVNSAASGAPGDRPEVSMEQRSQILSSLLNRPTVPQSPYTQQHHSAWDTKKHNQNVWTQESGKGKKTKQQQPTSQSKKQKQKNRQSIGNWGSTGGDWGNWGTDDRETDNWRNDDWTTNDWEADGWGNKGGWGDAKRDHVSPRGRLQNLLGGQSPKPSDNQYQMPSKTLSHAYKGTTTALDTGFPVNKMNEYTNVEFVESKGAALEPVHEALYGSSRLAKDRIHWLFSPQHDARVAALLAWVDAMAYNLGTYGLHKFLQSREKGALFTSVEYRKKHYPNGPAFDWLTFDDIQRTNDRTLQESVAFYDPAVQVIVLVFLPSKSGKSMAIWRRKINVPNNTRMMFQREIAIALSALRRDSQYIIHLDENPKEDRSARSSNLLYGQPKYSSQEPKRKKSKWWQFWRIDWD